MKATERAAEIISRSSATLALTGAGISAESGIPPFRGQGGLWDRYNPEEYATIDAFLNNPGKVWNMLKEVGEIILKSKPNDAHRALAELEEMGKLRGIVTQNIDGLHQAAGNKTVIEFHGTHKQIICMSCCKRIKLEQLIIQDLPPLCSCGGILKPEVVLFGEPIPYDALRTAFQEASTCKALLVIGTSAVVAPASQIPLIAKQNAATIIEINTESTILTTGISDIFLEGSASQILPQIVNLLKQ
ncbi:MAG: NAD-dependent deacylase [Acidobacteriota bacterium]